MIISRRNYLKLQKLEKEKLSTINDELKCLFIKMQRRLEKEPFYSDDISTVNILIWLSTAQITKTKLLVIIHMWGEEMFITHLPRLFKVNSRLTDHDKVWSLLVSVSPKVDKAELDKSLKELEEIL